MTYDKFITRFSLRSCSRSVIITPTVFHFQLYRTTTPRLFQRLGAGSEPGQHSCSPPINATQKDETLFHPAWAKEGSVHHSHKSKRNRRAFLKRHTRMRLSILEQSTSKCEAYGRHWQPQVPTRKNYTFERTSPGPSLIMKYLNEKLMNVSPALRYGRIVCVQ